MLTYTLFPAPAGGFGYRIYQDGAAIVEQVWVPGAEGFSAMTEAQAKAYAEAAAAAS